MSRVRNPIEKKRLSLARDHRVFALDGNKTFRKAWRLKKLRAARKLRREQAKVLSQSGPMAGELDETTSKPKRSLEKLGVMSLSQSISFKDGALGHRWNLRVLAKNKKALEAAGRGSSKRPRRK